MPCNWEVLAQELTCTWTVRAATLSFSVPELTTDLNHCESDDFSLAFTEIKHFG